MTTETIPLTQDQGGARPDGPGASRCATGADTVSAHSGDAPSRSWQAAKLAASGLAFLSVAFGFLFGLPIAFYSLFGLPGGFVAILVVVFFLLWCAAILDISAKERRDSDSRRMAETGTGSVRSTASAGPTAIAQPSSEPTP